LTAVLADLPGLIEGAHAGKGLGDVFLRHIERTRIILHLVDVGPDATPPAGDAYGIVRRELERYSATLAGKPEIVVANKLDIPGAKKGMTAFRKAAGKDVIGLSAATGEGLKALVREIFSRLQIK
ncbi:MAG: 50S ribosome-binding GTPase, partial [Planctomycetes bacterium]|nr:50S ribosome-binding GTPase [Planctomycetota bacterium]